jgi:hypothetical protein
VICPGQKALAVETAEAVTTVITMQIYRCHKI